MFIAAEQGGTSASLNALALGPVLEASATFVPAVDEKLPPVAPHIGLLTLGLFTKSRRAKFLKAAAALSAVLK